MFDFDRRHHHHHQNLFQPPSSSSPSQLDTPPLPPLHPSAGQTIISTPPHSFTTSPLRRHHLVDWNAAVFDVGNDAVGSGFYTSAGRRYGGMSPTVDILTSPSTSRRCPDLFPLQRGSAGPSIRDPKVAQPTSTFKPGDVACVGSCGVGGNRGVVPGLRHDSLAASFSNLI